MKNKLLALLLILLFIPLLAEASTTHYSYVTPTVGASQNTWGTLLNTIFGQIDTNIWNASNGTTIGVNAPAASGSNITLTNPINNVQNIQFSTTSKNLILPPMNATASVVPGGIFYVSNVGSNTFAIVAQDGSTSIVAALTAGQTVALQLTSSATANGTFNIYGPYLTGVGVLSLGTSVTTASPSIASDATTGFYTAGAGKVDVGVSGTKIVEWTSSGLNIPALTASSIVATDGSKNLTTITALPNGTTATTQTAADSTTKVATTAFVNGTALTLTAGTTATTQSPGDNSTKVATTAFVAANVTSANIQTFTSTGSGTWTKPTNATKVYAQCWGAGGGGGGDAGGGGGGGASETDRWYSASALGATESVFIGTGGAGCNGGAACAAGTNSTFSSSANLLTAYGGGGATNQAGGGGAGVLGVGGSASGSTGGTAGTGGGGIGCNAVGCSNPTFPNGGGGGGNQSTPQGGNSFAGGGGGGALGGSPGSSVIGGNGGACGNPGAAGSQPGGGGGGTCAGAGGGVNGGSGGNGKCIVTTFP